MTDSELISLSSGAAPVRCQTEPPVDDSQSERPQRLRWNEATLRQATVVLHLIPWVLFLLVAFRLVPEGWQYEQWPAAARNLATLLFGLFVLADTALAVWFVAFRKGGRLAF